MVLDFEERRLAAAGVPWCLLCHRVLDRHPTSDRWIHYKSKTVKCSPDPTDRRSAMPSNPGQPYPSA